MYNPSWLACLFHRLTHIYVCGVALLIVLFMQACGTPSMNPSAAQIFNQKSEIHKDGFDSEVIRAQNAHFINTPVTVVAPVARILDDDDVGLPHQKFLIKLSNGTTVLVAHNTRMAPRVPIKVGDLVTIHGDFVWNTKGGLIHWTHHSNSPKHQGGWIEFRGQIFQ